jgi:hypothetical protein
MHLFTFLSIALLTIVGNSQAQIKAWNFAPAAASSISGGSLGSSTTLPQPTTSTSTPRILSTLRPTSKGPGTVTDLPQSEGRANTRSASSIVPRQPAQSTTFTTTRSQRPITTSLSSPLSVPNRRSVTSKDKNMTIFTTRGGNTMKAKSSSTRRGTLTTRSNTRAVPAATQKATRPSVCRCDPAAKRGMYCGYCNAVESCDKKAGCWDNAYGCNGLDCMSFGKLDYCSRSARKVDNKTDCPLFSS